PSARKSPSARTTASAAKATKNPSARTAAPTDDDAFNAQVEQWRAFLLKRKGVSASDVDELEEHLRDEADALTSAGLSRDEAFLVAVKRMGGQDELSREFARVHSARLWKVLVL